MHGGFDGWLACARNFFEREITDSLLQRPEIERREDRVSVASAHRLGALLLRGLGHLVSRALFRDEHQQGV